MITIKNHAEYLDLGAKAEANEKASMEYCKKHKTNGIPMEIYKKFPFDSEINNDVRSALETYEFVHIPPKNTYFAYVNEKTQQLTTWMGQKLGDIICFNPEFRSNMGDKRQYITVMGINGVKYSGLYFRSAGNYARLRAVSGR